MEKKKVKKKESVKTVSKSQKNPEKKKSLLSRGRIFKGTVIRKFPKRITIEFERTIYVPKYERFMKKKTRIHARLPEQFTDRIQIGDIVKVQECRPLSKITHFLFIEKLSTEEK